jgi:hypothetical protein
MFLYPSAYGSVYIVSARPITDDTFKCEIPTRLLRLFFVAVRLRLTLVFFALRVLAM